jgi:hypothetical protein
VALCISPAVACLDDLFPKCFAGCGYPWLAEAICAFIRNNSINVSGIGDVCSLAQFDLERHGSRRYGGPSTVTREHRSRQVCGALIRIICVPCANSMTKLNLTLPFLLLYFRHTLVSPLDATLGKDGEEPCVLCYDLPLLGAAS